MKRNHALVDNYKPDRMIVKYDYIISKLDTWTQNDWDALFYFNKVDESFIRQFRDYITGSVWKTISKHQQISADFRREMFIKRS